MIRVLNAKQYSGVPFDRYQQLDGFGFSSIKNDFQSITPTKKMRFGSLVDNLLFTPSEYDGSYPHLVRPVAVEVKRFLGDSLNLCKAQLSCTADFEHMGLIMKYRGRPDLILPKSLVIDLKVSELPLQKAIEHFRYDWQLTGYCLALGIQRAMIISINPNTKVISTKPIIPVYDWWEHQIKRFGKPLLKAI